MTTTGSAVLSTCGRAASYLLACYIRVLPLMALEPGIIGPCHNVAARVVSAMVWMFFVAFPMCYNQVNHCTIYAQGLYMLAWWQDSWCSHNKNEKCGVVDRELWTPIRSIYKVPYSEIPGVTQVESGHAGNTAVGIAYFCWVKHGHRSSRTGVPADYC